MQRSTTPQSIRSSKIFEFAKKSKIPRFCTHPCAARNSVESSEPKCPLGLRPNGHFGPKLDAVALQRKGVRRILGFSKIFNRGTVFNRKLKFRWIGPSGLGTEIWDFRISEMDFKNDEKRSEFGLGSAFFGNSDPGLVKKSFFETFLSQKIDGRSRGWNFGDFGAQSELRRAD